MPSLQPWLILVLAGIGNCGGWLYCFNRINSTGLPRRVTKRFEKLFIFLCFAIPLCIFWAEWSAIAAWFSTAADGWPSGVPWLNRWLIVSLISALLLGPGWLWSRLWLIPPPNLLHQASRQLDVSAHLPNGSAANRTTRLLAKLPGNEITLLEVTRKELLLPRSIALADGLKIGHISDLHFTGQLCREHYQYVIQRFMELEPDLIAITGDIIDVQNCVPWICDVLGPLQATLGCHYVLGNHDIRLEDFDALIAALKSLGFNDLGLGPRSMATTTGLEIRLHGNELPWLNRGQAEEPKSERSGRKADERELRLGLSHSPDQIEWARGKRLDLLLAGHTHGGQVRFPGIGPIVAPSRYGSRFASGVFHLPPTLMHVSRGLAGTHPLRWRCKPEVSLLTLRSP